MTTANAERGQKLIATYTAMFPPSHYDGTGDSTRHLVTTDLIADVAAYVKSLGGP